MTYPYVVTFTKNDFDGNCIKCPEMHRTLVYQPSSPWVRDLVVISLKIF